MQDLPESAKSADPPVGGRMGKTRITGLLSLEGQRMENRHTLIIQNHLSIGGGFVFQVGPGEIEYAFSNVALAGKRKGRLLGEALPAAGASPANDKTGDQLDQHVVNNVEAATPNLVSSEQIRRGLTDGTRWQLTTDFVAQHIVAVLINFDRGNRARTWHDIPSAPEDFLIDSMNTILGYLPERCSFMQG